MSMEYCKECDRMIDLDYDCEHEHFQEMTKLKTLKDIAEGYSEIEFKTSSIAGFYEALKQEAIKWAKFRGKGEIQEWIKHFFNITEEELK